MMITMPMPMPMMMMMMMLISNQTFIQRNTTTTMQNRRAMQHQCDTQHETPWATQVNQFPSSI